MTSTLPSTRAPGSRPQEPSASGSPATRPEPSTTWSSVSLETGKYPTPTTSRTGLSAQAAPRQAGYPGLEVTKTCTVPDSPDDAYWIWSANASSVNNWTAFRKTFTIDDVAALPAKVNARISAETKYWLYVNQKPVVFEGSVKRGPNRHRLVRRTMSTCGRI
ncbi:hypothetical protein [Aeromicrobium sp. UC242_57]|uniref:hypothetical protein n=1 Tax=Aeromicrobium sp. UC242_57 TaxID=3374624 RepID=UPI0037A2C5FA